MAHQFSFQEKGRFTVTSRAGYNLACRLDLPSVPRESEFPEVAVACHGLYQTKESKTILATSYALLENPTTLDAVVRFDFHGEGESSGFEAWSLGGYEDEVEDLRDVVEFMKSKGCKVKLILGHSRAATVVVLYAAKYGDVPLVVPIAGRLKMAAGIEQHINKEKMQKLQSGETVSIVDPYGAERKVTPDCLRRRIDLDVKSALCTIRETEKIEAICIIHGDKDSVIPLKDAEEVYETLGNKDMKNVTLHIIKNTGHDVGSSKNVKEFHAVLHSFMDSHRSS